MSWSVTYHIAGKTHVCNGFDSYQNARLCAETAELAADWVVLTDWLWGIGRPIARWQRPGVTPA